MPRLSPGELALMGIGLVVSLVVAAILPAASAPSDADLQTLVDELAAEKERQLAGIANSLARERRTRVRTAEEKKEKRERIAELLEQQKELKRPQVLCWLMIEDSQVGIGLMGVVKVLQVLDDDRMIVKARGTSYLVSGVSTEGIADDDSYRLSVPFQLGETFTYTTVIGGSNTIRTVRPFREGLLNPFLGKE